MFAGGCTRKFGTNAYKPIEITKGEGHMSFRKNKLSALVAAISGLAGAAALVSPQVVAQEDTITEEVVVQGFRQSLEAALNIKRSAANNVESIVAEDIGKMPDLNLAESLQRVPGVAITREGGEGRNITVRGLGPGYTRTTLNGMEVPASTGGLDSSGGVNRGKDFDFNVFPSEIFNRIDINKSAIASIEEGGLASTVELYTQHPLDNPGLNASIGAQTTVDSFAGEADPRLTAVFSNTFADDTFGVLVSVARSERTVRQQGYGTVRYSSPYANGQRSWVGFDSDVTINGTPNVAALYPGVDIQDLDGDPLTVGLPGEDGGDNRTNELLDFMWFPRLPRMDSFNREQERTGYTGSFKFRPSDLADITLDLVGSKLKADVSSYNYFALFRNTFQAIEPTSITLDPTGRYAIAGSFNNVTPRSESRGQFSETDFLQTVLSGKFSLTDAVSMDVMYGRATSEHEEDQYRYNLTASDGHTFSYSNEANADIAEMSFGFDILDPANYEWSGPTIRRDIVERTNDTFKVDFTVEGDNSSVKAGYIWNSREIDSARWDPVDLTTPSAPDASLTNSLSDVIDDFGNGISAPSGFPTNWLIADYDATNTAYNAGTFVHVPNDSSTFNVTEETSGAYVEANVETELLGRPLTLNTGLRVVETTITSKGVVDDGTGTDTYIPTELESSYTDVLPATNIVWEPADDFLVRLGLSRNISRPGPATLAGTINVTPINGNVAVGNPDLDPERANAVDLSFEWYFTEESLLALTIFHKEIETFITGSTTQGALPSNVRDIVAARPEYDSSSPLFEPSALDPFSNDWNVTTSTNGEGADVDGYEIAYQQPLSFLDGWASGFGVFANFTHVKSRAEFGNGILGSLEGLSEDSYNLGLYYETDNYGARVVVNGRDDYITDQTGSDGNASHATTGPTRVDMSAFWNATEQFKVTLEVINATNEEERLFTTGPVGDLDLVREYNSTGTEILLGARYTF